MYDKEFEVPDNSYAHRRRLWTNDNVVDAFPTTTGPRDEDWATLEGGNDSDMHTENNCNAVEIAP